MKKFTENKTTKPVLDIQPNSINYISADELEEYSKIASKFIMPETKEIINWLIVNNETYLYDLDPKMSAENALAAFYNAGIPKDEKYKELYKLVGKVVRAERLLEIPVFQTSEQFKAIVNKKVSPDEILLDLKTEKGRTAVFKKYEPLIWKIVNQHMERSTLPKEELYAVACLGFVNAMNSFGHSKKRDENGKWVEVDKEEQHTNYTFGQYVANQMRNQILGAMEDSHLVRIPKSQQKKERDEKGYNTRNTSVSGDQTVGHDNEGNGKTLFDYIDNAEAGGKNLDAEDLQKLWQNAYAKLEEKFGKEDMEIFYRCFRLNGYENEKKKQKDIALEYGLKPTTLNVRIHKVIEFIKKDKILLDMFTNILELMHECKQEQYREEDQFEESHKLPSNINLDNNNE